ncbi:MAG: hypothetical protein QM793_03455 [Muricomes sp.]
MSETEKEILKTIADALPEMPDIKKGEFLGYAKAMADAKKKNKQKKPASGEQDDS